MAAAPPSPRSPALGAAQPRLGPARPRLGSIGPRRVWPVVLVAALAGALFAAFPQTRLHHDGCWMLWHHASGDYWRALHVAQLPLAALLGAVLPAERFLAAPWLLSGLCGGLGLAGSGLLVLRFGATPWRAAAVVALLAATPALVFWSTQVDTHSLHFAAIAWSLLGLTFAARLPGATGVLVGALCLIPPAWAHQSTPILLPGFVLLFLRLRGYELREFWQRAGVLAAVRVGVAFGAAFAVAIAVSSLLRTGELPFVGSFFGESQRGEQLDMIESAQRYQAVASASWPQWLWTFLGLLPLGVLGWWRAGRERLWLLAFLAPGTLFFLWYRVPEMGGHYLHQLPVYGLLVHFALPKGRAALGICLGLAAVHTYAAVHAVRDFDRGFDPRVRAALLVELGGPDPLVVEFVQDLPNAAMWQAGVVRSVRNQELVEALLKDFDPELFGTVAADQLATVVGPPIWAAGRAVLVDLTDPGSFDRIPRSDAVAPFLAAVERALEATFQVTRVEADGWCVLRVEPR